MDILPPAGRTSVTILHDSTKSYGLRLMRRHKTKEHGFGYSDGSNSELNNDKTDDMLIDMIAKQHSDGLLQDSPINVGDVLQTINNKRATEFLGGRDYIRSGSFDDGQAVTFVVEKPSDTETHDFEAQENDELESGSAIVRAFCRRPIISEDDKKSMTGIVEFHRVVVEVDEPQDNEDEKEREKGDGEGEGIDSAPTKSYSSFLQIDRIHPNGMFAHSVLNQGDVVLAINGHSVCADENTTAEEANALLLGKHASETSESSSSEYETVDILALNPRALVRSKQQNAKSGFWNIANRKERLEKMKKQARRAGVAIGGGAMLGVGAIVHPFGTLLLPVGLSVLGTEFEAPNRLVRNARNSFERWSEIELPTEAQEVSSNPDIVIGANYTIDDIANSATCSSPPVPLPSTRTRMKGFGRRYVLPFLDKMAGDRRNIEPTSSFDIPEDFNIMGQKSYTSGQDPFNPIRYQLQGRDDDCAPGNGSEASLEQNHQPTPAVSLRVL